MDIVGKIALVTGAASGIGQAVAEELAKRGAGGVMLVDIHEHVHEAAKKIAGTEDGPIHADAFVGDVTDESFRKEVFGKIIADYGVPRICVPAAGITRDRLAVKASKSNGHIDIYPLDQFRQVMEVNLVAPTYWALEMIARIAQSRREEGLKGWHPDEMIQGTVIFIGSVSSQGNKGQISYATTKAGLEGAAATLTKEGMFYGVRCGVIHPGFTNTAMVQALGDDFINEHIIPHTQLRRLIKTEEIADAICFMISNSAVSGQLWADAGWHPSA